VETNAVAWKSALPIDLLVSETLDSGLVRENFHQIVNHLRPCLAPDGRIVPEHIQIQGGFARANDIFSGADLNPILQWSTRDALGDRISLPLSVAIGELAPGEESAVQVQSFLTLYQRRNNKEAIDLRPGESPITRRVVLRDAQQVLSDLENENESVRSLPPGELVKISYHYPPGHRALLALEVES
jgi:hypothetical protein